MSTKVSIKWRHRVEGRPSFHLYDDVMDTLHEDVTGGDDARVGPEPPVYLQLEGVAAELRTLPSGGASVTVTIPRDIARELGLLPAKSPAGTSPKEG